MFRLVALALVIVCHGQNKELPDDYPYCPAFVAISDNLHRTLVLFPHHGRAIKIPIRSLGNVLFSPDGRALYGSCTPYRAQEVPGDPIKIGVCKVDLYAGSITPISGVFHDLSHRGASTLPKVIRVFGLTPPEGKPTMVPLPADEQPWSDLNLSPDGRRALAVHEGRPQLIDMVTGTIQPLGDNFFMAQWSPNGKWLAAVENGENGRTILMDAATLSRQRILGHSELQWSPDSRYLLGIKRRDGCGPYTGGTLKIIDVDTGDRTTIESSRCQVNRTTIGWVRCDITAK